MTPEVEAKRHAELDAALAAYLQKPGDPEANIWLGRRFAYLGQYHQAIEIFSEGIAKHPKDARFYRHRGHRFITVREIDAAIADLAKAQRLIATQPDMVEPDGQPNARNVPLTTLHGNVLYHLGLARYLKGDFAGALEAYEACAKTASNPDHLVSTTYWIYLALRHMGREADAKTRLEAIPEQLELLENGAYHRLLLLFKTGTLPPGAATGPDNATIAYGVGAWNLLEGRRDEGVKALRRAAADPGWAAFGVIAAEAELSRMPP